MKRVNLGFEVEAAKPKRPSRDDDAPRQVPMRAGLNDAQRRKPLTDDKKVRHQMARQQRTAATLQAMAAAFARRVEAGDMLLMTDQYEMTQNIYQIGFMDALDGKPATPEGIVGLGVPDQYGHPQEDEREWYIKGYTDGMLERGTAPHPLDDRMPARVPVAAAHQERESSMDTSIQREADLLEAMGHATLDEQRRLATDLDALRATRRLAFEDDRDTEFADEIVADHLTPVVTHALNTTATDWLGEVEDDLPDQDQVQQLAATEASLWWGRTHEAVKEDRTELNVQARGWAARWASQYGPYAEVANTAFMSHVAHLAKQVLGEDTQTCAVCGAPIERDPPGEDPQTWHHADGDKHDHEAKPKGDGDSDKKDDDSSKTSALRTVADVADLPAFEVEAATDDEFAFEGVTAAEKDPTCPKCGSSAISYSKAKLYDGHTSKCHNCGNTFDQEHAYAQSSRTAAGDSPGEVDPEQSGEAESSLPYDHPVADDYDPMWSEDWPAADQPVIDPPMPGAGEGVRQGAKDDGSIFCSRCGGSGMVRNGGAVRNCTSCGGSGIKRQVRKKNPDLDAVLPDHSGSRQVRGEQPWNAGYNDALGGHQARVASKDVGSAEWYYTEGYLAGLNDRQAAVGDAPAGTPNGVPEEIEKLDDPDNRPMWPWDLEEPGNGAADVANAKNPNDHTSGLHGGNPDGPWSEATGNVVNPRTAASEIEQAIREHAEHLQGTLKPGDRVGNATVTNVGSHTVQYRTDDGWEGSMQIPFLNGQGESLPSHQRALDATSKLAAFRSTIAANLKKGAA